MNAHQVLPMAAYFKEQGITLRFIEFMDVGSTNGWNFDQVVTKQELIEMIHSVYHLSQLKHIISVKLRSDIATLEQILRSVLLLLFLNHFVPLVREREFRQMESFILAYLRQKDWI